MPEPDRQRLETALQNAHNAGDTEAAKVLAAEIRKLDAAPGINIMPAPQTTPGQRVQQRIDEVTPMAAAAAQRQIATSPVNPDVQMNIVIDPESGLPVARGQSTNEAWLYGDYNPDATFMDYVDTSNPWSQRATVLQRGAPLGAGDEIIGAVAGENAEQVADDLYARAYAERPLESFILEGASAFPTGGLVAKGLSRAGAGPRTIATAESAIYGFNDPFIGGDSFEARALNAVPSAIGGRVLGGIGTSTVNVGKRLNNRVSGNPTIQSVAQDDFGITLTEGQITQDVGKQSFERDARKGSKGQDAAQVAIQAFKDQEEATLNAGRSIGGDRFATSNQAAGDFLSGVQGRIQTQQEAINQAYDRARGFNATLSPEGSQSMPQAVVGGLDNDLLQQIEIDPEGFKQLHPNTAAALRSVVNLGNAGREGGLPFEQLETTRRIINNAISASTQNPADRRAAMQVKASFDRFVDDSVDQALFDSDDAFISAYREARGLRAQFAEDWEANKVFKRLIENEATPEMAINFVLGGGRLAGDNQMVVLRQLKTALKDDPEVIAALQEAYMKKIMRQTEKTFNPQVLRDSLDELLIGKNESFAKTLLDDDQYAQLRKFRAVVDSMVPMDGTVNTSNTAAALERTKGAVTDFLTGPMRSGPVRATGRFMNELLGKYIVRTGGSRARQQFNPPAGLDTRRIESGYPAGSVLPSGNQLPGSGGGSGPANAFATEQATPTTPARNAFADPAPADPPVQNGLLSNGVVTDTVGGGAIGSMSGNFVDYNQDGVKDEKDVAIGAALGAGGMRLARKGSQRATGTRPAGMKQYEEARLRIVTSRPDLRPGTPEYQAAVLEEMQRAGYGGTQSRALRNELAPKVDTSDVPPQRLAGVKPEDQRGVVVRHYLSYDANRSQGANPSIFGMQSSDPQERTRAVWNGVQTLKNKMGLSDDEALRAIREEVSDGVTKSDLARWLLQGEPVEDVYRNHMWLFQGDDAAQLTQQQMQRALDDLPPVQNGFGGGADRRRTQNQIRNGLAEAGGQSRANPVSIEGGRPVEPLPDNLRAVVDETNPIPGGRASSRQGVEPWQARTQLREDLLAAGDDPQQVDNLIELLGDDVVHVLRERQVGPAASWTQSRGVDDGSAGLKILVGILGAGGAALAIREAMRESGNTKATPEDVSRALEEIQRRQQGLPPTPSLKPPLNAFAVAQ